VTPKERGPKRSKRSRILGPYIPYDLLQTKGETCVKFGSDRFRNVDLYKFHTNKQTFNFIYKIYINTNTQPPKFSNEDGSKKPKHEAESCKFIKYSIQSCVTLYFIAVFT
jgi:hypothetical protein